MKALGYNLNSKSYLVKAMAFIVSFQVMGKMMYFRRRKTKNLI